MTMPNEPAFAQKGEVKALGAVGVNHFETQAAVSVTNHIGFTGSYYKGYTGKVNVFEGGINFYTRMDSAENMFFSASAGVGGGNCIRNYEFSLNVGGGGKRVYLNNNFMGSYLQASIYKVYKNKFGQRSFGFGVKADFIKFTNYYMTSENLDGLSANSYEIMMTAHNAKTTVVTPYLNYYTQKHNSRWYWQLQVGSRYSGGMKTNMQTVYGNIYHNHYDEINNYYKLSHPIVNRLFFNIALGYKIN
jgi:hypothetical protein